MVLVSESSSFQIGGSSRGYDQGLGSVALGEVRHVCRGGCGSRIGGVGGDLYPRHSSGGKNRRFGFVVS